MKYGYARVSTDDQSPCTAALQRAGCKMLFKTRVCQEPRRSALPCSSLIATVVGGYQFAHGEPSAKNTDDIPRILG